MDTPSEQQDPELKEFAEKMRERKEKLELQDFQQKADDYLDKYHKKIVGSRGHLFCKIMTILFFLLLATGLCLFFFTDRLDNIFHVQVNNTVNPDIDINNDYDFSPNIYNDYEHNIYNNHTIINEVYCP